MNALKASILPLFLLSASAACGPSVESVCNQACEKSEECNLEVGALVGFSIFPSMPRDDEEVEICKAGCDQLQKIAEQGVDTGEIRSQECLDRRVDYANCVTGLECSDLRDAPNFRGECNDQLDDERDACN